jgi:hypothetical protein
MLILLLYIQQVALQVILYASIREMMGLSLGRDSSCSDWGLLRYLSVSQSKV